MMAVELALTDGAAEWLRDRLKKTMDDWRWSDDPNSTPTLDDRLYLREIMQALDK
jgi:hypothetical protein